MFEYSAAEQLLILLITLLVPPLFLLVILILLLATFGKSLGLRRAYVRLLLQIFEWASKRIERARREELSVGGDKEEEESETDDSVTTSSQQSNDHRRSPSENRLIKKDASARILRKISQEGPLGNRVFTIVDDSLDFIKAGLESIIEDDVTLRFSAEELASWNLLSRTSYGHQYVSVRLTIVWCLGFAFRYFVLFPIRLVIFVIGLTFLVVSTAVVGYVPDGDENKAEGGGICVANHTSPIDVLILAQDNCYALVGQSHGGLLGLIQRSLSRASSHIWFERSEANDRTAVRKRLQEHVQDKQKLPILLFPEGTCINNTSVMMFKKGSFEVGGYVYPVAIKYDPRFGDPFWNSAQQSYFQYLLMMMTSWAIVVDIWYLPPMVKAENENAVQFAARVKRAIAAAGGLVDLEWDGQLKRYPVKKEMLEKQQERYSKRIQMARANSNSYEISPFSSPLESPIESLVDLITKSTAEPDKEVSSQNFETSVDALKQRKATFEAIDSPVAGDGRDFEFLPKHSQSMQHENPSSSLYHLHLLSNGSVVTDKFVELENIKENLTEKIDNTTTIVS